MAKQLKNKKMTIEDLAVMTQKGFKEVGQRIDDFKVEVYRRFDEVDKRFDAMDERLDQVEFHTNSQERRLSILEDKVRMISVKVGLSK